MEEEKPDFTELNNHVKKFSRDMVPLLLKSQYRLGIDETGYLEASTKSSTYYEFGVAYRVAFKFLRYGVFVEKGVGKGYPIESAKTNSSIARGTGKGRVAKPWFNPVVDEELKKLADILQDDMTEIVTKSIRIK